jgi:phosphate acetyltransferase
MPAAKLSKERIILELCSFKWVMPDALLGGATYSTADTVRPALQLIKTKPVKK